MSFSQQVSGAFLETTGCLSFYADASERTTRRSRSSSRSYPTALTSTSLAAGAEREDQAVCFDDRRLILFVAPPNFDDDDAAAFDFSEYVDIARTYVARVDCPWDGTIADAAVA